MPEIILFSQIPLPYSKIGSWSTLYDNYLSQNHQIDFLICEKPEEFYSNIQYIFVENNLFSKIKSKITKNNFLAYQTAFSRIIKKDKKYIIQIIDNTGLAKHINQFLIKNKLRNQFYIQFFYHGFMPIDNVNNSNNFYEKIDELILLTQLSYDFMKLNCNVITPKISILNNGIDSKKFFKISNSEKLEFKNSLGFNDKKIMIWCSQDRPKKGLHIILEAWQTIHKNNPNTILLIIGCEPRMPQEGVRFLGKIPNNDLPKYYQIADVYLFPTLCQEGFPMSLTEALHCGCYCIASKMGGVPEVLNSGKWGVLIENPNFVSEWITSIQDFLDNNTKPFEFINNVFTTKNWNQEMNTIIENAKNCFH